MGYELWQGDFSEATVRYCNEVELTEKALMWGWILKDLEAFRVAILALGLLGGVVGLCFAGWRCWIANRALLRQRCQMGLELLSLNSERYTARVAGASILSELLDNNSTEYDSSILRAFEAFLFSPPRFGMDLGKHKEGETDYESRDTFLIVRALNRYACKKNAQPMLQLPCGLVFRISETTVEPNPHHPHYASWTRARGSPPEYSD